jgi:hypothetical protein
VCIHVFAGVVRHATSLDAQAEGSRPFRVTTLLETDECVDVFARVIRQAAGLGAQAVLARLGRTALVEAAVLVYVNASLIWEVARRYAQTACPRTLRVAALLKANQCVDLLAAVVRQAAGLHAKAELTRLGCATLVETAVLVYVNAGLIWEVARRYAQTACPRTLRVAAHLSAAAWVEIEAAIVGQATRLKRLAGRPGALKKTVLGDTVVLCCFNTGAAGQAARSQINDLYCRTTDVVLVPPRRVLP